MKRALLIVGGTVGGLGAVLSITPPQFDSTPNVGLLPATNTKPTTQPSATATPKTTSTPEATKKAATPKKTTAATPKATATPTPSQTQAQTQTQSSGAINGTFTGNSYNICDLGPGFYCNNEIVQVKVTIIDSKIVDAQAVKFPKGGANYSYSMNSIPTLRQQTIAANGSGIRGTSQASYTSYGWYQSLVSALKKAGME